MHQPPSSAGPRDRSTFVERRSDLEFTATRIFNAPIGAVYAAWIEPACFQRWWVPQSAPGIRLTSCKLDVRTGGKYRLDFAMGNTDKITFFGKYLEVVENQKIVWTNEEGEEGAITSVTFDELGTQTRVTLCEIYPTTEGLKEALASSALALPEQFEQLANLLADAG